MATFNESQHPRAGTGQFTEKALAGPAAVTLDVDSAESRADALVAGHLHQISKLLDVDTDPQDRAVAMHVARKLERAAQQLFQDAEVAEFRDKVFRDPELADVALVELDFHAETDRCDVVVKSVRDVDGNELDSDAVEDLVVSHELMSATAYGVGNEVGYTIERNPS